MPSRSKASQLLKIMEKRENKEITREVETMVGLLEWKSKK